MAIWFMDGFDHYSMEPAAVPPATAYTDLTRKWSVSAGNITVSPGYARQPYGQGVRLAAMSLDKVRPGAAVDVLGMGVWFLLTAINTAHTLLTWLDGTTEQCSVRTDTSGHITFTRNGTVLATSTNVLTANVWYHIEAKALIHDSAGTYEVRINGSATGWIAPATGKDTKNTTNAQVTSVRLSAGSVGYFDDFFSWDLTGTYNVDFLGPQIVRTLRPVSAGNYAAWVSNYGLNHGAVGDTAPDGDGSFVHSATPGDRDSHVFQGLAFSAATIAAVQHTLYARQDAGAARQIKPFQRIGSTDYDGTTADLAASYQMLSEVSEVDPSTGVPYTVAGLNAAEFGYKLES